MMNSSSGTGYNINCSFGTATMSIVIRRTDFLTDDWPIPIVYIVIKEFVSLQ